jgi:CheY-like chemotaxis protein
LDDTQWTVCAYVQAWPPGVDYLRLMANSSPSAPMQETGAIPPVPPAAVASEGQGRILVVDDERLIREFFRRALLMAGFDVVVASGGAEGLKMLGVDPQIQVVFLDLNMPHIDGWAFRAAQLSDPRLAGVPVVIVTGTAPNLVKDAELRADDYLRKPIGTEQLVAVAARYCSRRAEVSAG